MVGHSAPVCVIPLKGELDIDLVGIVAIPNIRSQFLNASMHAVGSRRCMFMMVACFGWFYFPSPDLSLSRVGH